MTTFSDFVTALGDLDIECVDIRLDEPPTEIVDLPCQWVALPRATQATMTFVSNGGWPNFTAYLVVAFEAVAQDTQAANWQGTIQLIDNLNTALSTARNITKSPLSWDIYPDIRNIAGIDYWVLIAEVSGNG